MRPARLEQAAAGIFNIADDEPAPPQDVVEFARHLAGGAPAAGNGLRDAQLSPMARSFYGGNKRVSNAKSKAVLGMEYDYPDYAPRSRACGTIALEMIGHRSAPPSLAGRDQAANLQPRILD